MPATCSVILPTLNAADRFPEVLEGLRKQSITPLEIVVIDSSSSDQTAGLARQWGCKVLSVSREEFDHGGTRNIGAAYSHGEFLVFMTQDAFPDGDRALERLLHPFCDPRVAAVCGRQVPQDDADPLASHARIFNYPSGSCIKSKQDIPRLGIKVPFVSNSFAAYRRTIFQELGGFAENIVFGEDMHLAARMVLKGYCIAYAGDAIVRHSHNYSMMEEFRRYFDIGSFHGHHPWIQREFGSAGGEGFRLMRSQLSFAGRFGFAWVVRSLYVSGMKYIAYSLGRHESCLPVRLKRKLGLNSAFWSRETLRS